MRILVVDEEIPFPLNSGKRLRTFNLLKPLASRHEITFICRQHGNLADNSALGLEEAGIHTVVVTDPIQKKQGVKFYLALLANLFSHYPYTVSSHYSPLLVSRIAKLLQENRFDLIHCEWTPYAINLQQWLGTVPTIVDAHNIEAMIWKRNFQVERNALKKAYIYLQWRKMRAFEQSFFPKFTRCVAVSEQDAKSITEIVPKHRVDVV
ncbi:MAG: glycosyltransferase, partial [Chlorobium sp.]|nr:glycosyltransferase [Chlorobium sp.]